LSLRTDFISSVTTLVMQGEASQNRYNLRCLACVYNICRRQE